MRDVDGGDMEKGGEEAEMANKRLKKAGQTDQSCESK